MIKQPERRRAPRAPERIAVALSEAGRVFQAETQNLSEAGAYCTLDRFLPPMSKLELHFELPAVIGHTRVRCTGVVVRVEPVVKESNALCYNTAFYFTDISKRHRAAIARFVRRRLAAAHRGS